MPLSAKASSLVVCVEGLLSPEFLLDDNGWSKVKSLLERLDGAWDAREMEMIELLQEDLEGVGITRRAVSIEKLSTMSRKPVPDDVRDLANRTITTLVRVAGASAKTKGK